MNCLLTSSGIRNKTIHDALVGLLGKPISESNALFIPTAIYPFPGGATMAWKAISGKDSMCQLGWKSLGILELTVLSGIDKNAWIPSVQEADALLFWGGDPVYLSHWMRQSGLTALLPKLRREAVYVGVSAGSMAACATFGETFRDRPNDNGDNITSQGILFDTPEGVISRTLVIARGAGLVDFAIIPHLENKNHADASLANAEKWAARIPVQVYAIDDDTAIKVTDGNVEVISEGQWKLFNR